MHKALLAVFVALAFCNEVIGGEFSPPELGNCNFRCDVPLVPVSFELFASYKPWKVIYVTQGNIDGMQRDGFRLKKGLYSMTDSFKMKDKSVGKYRFPMSIVDNVIIQNGTANGKTYIIYEYPIAVTLEDGFLFHLCSPDGKADIDMRYIWIPHNGTLTNEGLNYLLEVDKKCNFRGELRKLSDKE